MADRSVKFVCRKLFSLHSSSLYAKSLRYIRRYLSSEVTCPSQDTSRISFITCGCNTEELENVQDMLVGNLEVRDTFISEDEESMLIRAVEPYLKRQKYQYDHWDDAIHGYRETEKSRWSQDCLSIFQRIKETAFMPNARLLPHVHVLDLNKNGFIKPHIDSVKFCGNTIAGLSLLSPSVMRFKHNTFSNVKVDALLNQRSLYIIRDVVRYGFTHEILHEDESMWKGAVVPRDRRISLVLRYRITVGTASRQIRIRLINSRLQVMDSSVNSEQK